jgi:hypothetical protein
MTSIISMGDSFEWPCGTAREFQLGCVRVLVERNGRHNYTARYTGLVGRPAGMNGRSAKGHVCWIAIGRLFSLAGKDFARATSMENRR